MHILKHWAQHSLPYERRRNCKFCSIGGCSALSFQKTALGRCDKRRAEKDRSEVGLGRTKLSWFFKILHLPYNDSCTHWFIIANCIASGMVWLLKEYLEARLASQKKELGDHDYLPRVSSAKMSLPVTSKSYFPCFQTLEILPKVVSFQIKILLNNIEFKKSWLVPGSSVYWTWSWWRG